ncbi:AAA family ATPase [Microbacterium sp. HA-8]|uniref:MinD/ParA family ATP-binding protein n=1 Tax=Microbacterium sp. HA-8 TaxID=3234200 RepID=UPI0038F5FB10
MSPHGNDPHAAGDRDDDAIDDVQRVGMLQDQPGVETSSIGILGLATAHVSIDMPVDADEDDDDVIDEDIRVFDELLAPAPSGDEHSAESEVEVEAQDETAPVTAEVVLDEAPASDVADEDALVEDAIIEEAEMERASSAPPEYVEDDPAHRDDAAPEYAEEIAEVDEATTVERASPRAAAHDDTMPESLDDEHSDSAEEEHTMPDPTEQTPVPAAASAVSAAAGSTIATRAAARDVGRTPTDETPVLTSRRIGELSEGSVRETADLLTTDRLLDPSHVVRPEPEGAWQHLLYSLTGGRVNLGDSKRARARKDLDRRISASLPGGGARFVAVLSRKGGVGKTTITTLLGMALADARDDRIIAVDANPDRGTLAERISRRSIKTVRDMVRASGGLRGYNDVSAIVARDETRLDVLASDTDPHVSEAFSDAEYRTVAEVAAHYYSIVLTDTGTGIVHSVMGATLDLSDQLIVVAGMSIDEARLASETLTWLESNGHEAQVREAIVVLNTASPGASLVRQDEVEAHFRSRVRDVVRVPYDSQIATGGPIVFRDLHPATRAAARELAVRVVDGLRAPAQVA